MGGFEMSIAEVRDRQNFAIYLAGLALVVALASFGRSPNPSANEKHASLRNERQYPPLVFTSNSWLDCSISSSSSANGRQVMTTTSVQGFTFDATMLPLQNGKLQLRGQTGMMYKFDSFPTAAVTA